MNVKKSNFNSYIYTLFIPPAKQSFRGYTVLSMSVILWLHDSVIPKFRPHLRFLLYNFDSFHPILFNFTPPLTIRQCMFDRKIGAEGSVLQELCHFVMFVLWLIVHTLWNQLLLELSLDLFNTLQICYRCIEDLHKEVWCWKKNFWQIDRVFNLAIFDNCT